MYSLLNASTLGFDLVRLPEGETLAAVLLDALALRAGDGVDAELPSVPAAPDAGRTPRVRDVLSDLAGARGEELHDAARRLRSAPLGEVEDLLAALGREWFAWIEDPDADPGPRARERLEQAYGAAVQAAWHGARLEWPPLASRPADLGPQRAELAVLLGQVRGLDADAFGQLEQAWSSRDHAVRWSQAMHAATWAVSLTRRERAAMAAQLELVRAVRGSAARSEHVAQGAWNSLSGIVQVLSVADLLDGASAEALTEHTREILRPVD